MKYLKFTLNFCVILFLLSCKKDNNKNIIHVQENQKKLHIVDTVIKGIDSTKISDVRTEKEKIIKLYFDSFQKDYNKPIINFNQVKNNYERIEVKKYLDLIVNEQKFQSYLISFSYENDEIYRAVLLTNNILNDGLILYEKVLDEGEYLRTSKIHKNIITNNVFRIEHFKYDKGNISGEIKSKDSLILLTNSYLVRGGYFLEYFKNGSTVDKQWGEKEIIYTKDGLDSSYVYLYKEKGKIKNNLKDGNWEERRYVDNYAKSVWMDGQYVNGLKNGDWNYSPEGPVDKVEVYNMGKLIKTYFP